MCRKLTLLFSLVLLLGAGRPVAAETELEVIAYDNGIPLRRDWNQNALIGVRFTPSGPFNLLAIDVMLRHDYNSDPCPLWVAQDNGGLPSWPGIDVGQIPAGFADSTWVRYYLAGPMYFEGDFFVVARQTGGAFSPGPGFWIGIDYGTTTGRTVKSYSDGDGWLDEPQGDATIRAVGWYSSPPCVIGDPYPHDGAEAIQTITHLQWTPCPLATGQDIYLGTDLIEVLTATRTSPLYHGQLPGSATTYIPAVPLNPCTEYFWRIDTVPCPTCPPTRGPIQDFRTTCDTPAPIQPKGDHSTVTTSDGSIRDDELADYVCEQIQKNGGRVKDVKIMINSCYGGGLIDDFQRVFGPGGECEGIPWVAGAASAADKCAYGWSDKWVEDYPGLGSGFTSALAGSKTSWNDDRKGSIRDRTTDNVQDDLETAGKRDRFGPNGLKNEEPVVATGNGGTGIYWHDPGSKHEAVVFGGKQTNQRHHNNVNNVEQALKEVWPDGSYKIKKIDGGTAKDLRDAIADACTRLDEKTELVLYINDHGNTHFDVDEWYEWWRKTITYGEPLVASFDLHEGWRQGLHAMYVQPTDTPTPTLDITLLNPVNTNDWIIMLNDTPIPLLGRQLSAGDYELPVDWTSIRTGRNDLRISTNTTSATMELVALALSSGPINEIEWDGLCPLVGDLNLDCIVDFADFAILAEQWLQTRPICCSPLSVE